MNTRLQWGKVEIEYEDINKKEELDICVCIFSKLPNWEGAIYHFGKDNWNREPARIFLNWNITSLSDEYLHITAYSWVVNSQGEEEKSKVYIKCLQPIIDFYKK